MFRNFTNSLIKELKLQLIMAIIQECTNSPYHNHSTVITEAGHFFYQPEENDLYCPRTFDGLACWDPAPANSVAYQPCPHFVVGWDPRRMAYKSCLENGTWFTHPEGNNIWTNYTNCVDMDDLRFRSIVNTIYVWGYSFSFAALMLSVFTFLYFRTLHCTRVRIHVHLFLSFAFNNLLWILWYETVVNDAAVVQGNTVWCQALHIITNYFMVASYFWMFCEGLHLHIALVVIFVKDEITTSCFVAIGWGIPLLLTFIYAVVRYNVEGATERCWIEQSDTFWIIIIPVLCSLLASFFFMINVVRVLLTKLRPTAANRASIATKKAVRAALILIPLFGLHFILIPLRPPPDTPAEKVYQIISALLTSLQGLCVSILFCFTNHDVIAAIRTQMTRLIGTNEIAMAGMTAGESLVQTRENVV